MRGTITKDPAWCSDCVTQKTPCSHHRGPDGQPSPYVGPEVYEPTDWILEVVGQQYKAWDGRTYLCFGYDPRHGFWMRALDGGPEREANVSERAIGRTYHRIWVA